MDLSKCSLFLLFCLLRLTFSPVYCYLPATIAQLLPIFASNRTQVYIVHVQHPSGSTDLLSAADRDNWYRSYLPNTTLDSGEPRMVFTYELVISGFAARLTPEEAEAMEYMDGFVFAHPEIIHSLHTTHTPHLLGLDQYNSLWRQSNEGEGIIIGVIDSGITPDHPSFTDTLGLPPPPLKWRRHCDLPKGSDACNNKLIGAQQFLVNQTPIDSDGHGTHVAGIAVGNPVYGAGVNGLARGTACGMAPRAHLAVYRVCNGDTCGQSSSLKGIEQAILNGVDIIQISYGAPNSFFKSSNVVGSFQAFEQGILTVCSAQNLGPFPSIISNDAPWILTVGAATIDRRATAVLMLGNGMEIIGQSGYPPGTSSTVDQLPLSYPGDKNPTQQVRTCQNGSMRGIDVEGKMVICGTQYTEPVEKSKVVEDAGGAAIILVNQPHQGDTLQSHPFAIPGIHIGFKDALKVVSYFKTDPNPTGSIAFIGTEFGFRPSPTVASFSSRGPSLYGRILKPDVIAPGVNILSAWPFDVQPNAGGVDGAALFNFVSGTSMATPHVSGIAALLKKSHPDWSPAMIKSAIMTTAYTEDQDGQPIIDGSTGQTANAFAVGAGHVNPSAADDPGLVYDTSIDDYIPYLCGLNGGLPTYQITYITKRPDVDCSKKMNPEELNYPSILVPMGAGEAKKKTIRRTVTNVGEANSIYTASVIDPGGVKVNVNPKTLQFASVGQKESFTVELSLTGSPPDMKDVWEGRLILVSDKHRVSSPIVVTA